MYKLIGTKDGAKPEVWMVREQADVLRYKRQLESNGWFTVIGYEPKVAK